MGKPLDAASPNPSSSSTPSCLTEPSASRTLHPPPPHRYFDEDAAELTNDDDDLPPLYSDHEEFNNTDSFTPFDPLLPRLPHGDIFETVHPFRRDETSTYFLDRRLDRDPDFLAGHIYKLCQVPPRPFVKLVGTHTESSSGGEDNNNRGRETKTVTDFDIEIELTHLLYSDARTAQARRSIRTAGNLEKVRRGTVFATRAPGFGGAGPVPEEGTPELREWCRRYCASAAWLRCFTVERKVEGYDWDALGARLEGLARAANYRGRVEVRFPVRQARVHVYSDCRVNRWRLTPWVVAAFTFSLAFVLAWPVLFLATRRWETVTAEWRMSDVDVEAGGAPGGRRRYVSLGEEAWYAVWAGTIQRAMLERRRGLLDQGDLQRTWARGGDGRQGDAVAAAVEAMGVVNRSFGWGEDSC
ncbi:hypothetical protein MGU_07056 [Metarhizium guizhouense ARSEF 977]|uniref:Uncharacterized protein n=1 Tax=Metarhizium guizhouense (strain ARSEF 977) TaxID=1276136 RepID=A0A0B4GSW2_METGA|nr:hypothetical protein MGU_07056 [Metarhizium guizhouense ARSEF 977]